MTVPRRRLPLPPGVVVVGSRRRRPLRPSFLLLLAASFVLIVVIGRLSSEASVDAAFAPSPSSSSSSFPTSRSSRSGVASSSFATPPPFPPSRRNRRKRRTTASSRVLGSPSSRGFSRAAFLAPSSIVVVDRSPRSSFLARRAIENDADDGFGDGFGDGDGGGSSAPESPSKTKDDDDSAPPAIPECVESPVLKQVYPALLRHVEEYGHPNIPLGSSDGRKCKTLRRLQTQRKLSEAEIELLEGIGFRFNDLEDVYREADFDELLGRLIAYEKEHRTGYQIPKKYKPDPELGAWVTAIRRLTPTGIDPSRREALDEIGFAWVSTRKCGSTFMTRWREIRDRLDAVGDDDGRREVLKDESVQKWIEAQREIHRNGKLSETRVGYMDKLGVPWREDDDSS